MDSQPRIAYSPEETGKLLGLSTLSVRRLIKSNRLHAVRAGRRLLISSNELARFTGEFGR